MASKLILSILPTTLVVGVLQLLWIAKALVAGTTSSTRLVGAYILVGITIEPTICTSSFATYEMGINGKYLVTISHHVHDLYSIVLFEVSVKNSVVWRFEVHGHA